MDAIAARDAAGKLWLAVTNLDPNRPARVAVRFTGMKVRGGRGEVLTAPRVDAVNRFDAPSVVAPRPIAGRVEGDGLVVEVPGKSVTVLQVEG